MAEKLDPMDKYRDLLIKAEQQAQENYDKTVLSLSGGALGISFAFIKDVVGDHPLVCPNLLLAAWASWGLSVTMALFSFYFSFHALRIALHQVNSGAIRDETPGSGFSLVTVTLNALAGALFLAGVILIVIFVANNLE